MGLPEARISFASLLKVLLSFQVVGTGELEEVSDAEVETFPGAQIARSGPHDLAPLLIANLGFDAGADRLRDVVLDLENIFGLPVILFRPDAVGRVRVDQLHADPDASASAAHTSLDDIMRAGLASDLGKIVSPAPKARGCIAGEHPKPSVFGKLGDDVCGDAVRKVVLA